VRAQLGPVDLDQGAERALVPVPGQLQQVRFTLIGASLAGQTPAGPGAARAVDGGISR
jgi:hypothetical protein